jgi:hypothetical protein
MFFIGTVALIGCSQVQIPSNWSSFEGEGFVIELPPSYSGGSGASINDAIQVYRQFGQDHLAASLDSNKERMSFYAVDSVVENSGDFLTSLVVTERVEVREFTLAQYADQYVLGLDKLSDTQILDSELIMLEGHEAWRIQAEVEGEYGKLLTVQYLIKSGSGFWLIQFFTSPEESEARFAQFKLSALSFQTK